MLAAVRQPLNRAGLCLFFLLTFITVTLKYQNYKMLIFPIPFLTDISAYKETWHSSKIRKTVVWHLSHKTRNSRQVGKLVFFSYRSSVYMVLPRGSNFRFCISFSTHFMAKGCPQGLVESSFCDICSRICLFVLPARIPRQLSHQRSSKYFSTLWLGASLLPFYSLFLIDYLKILMEWVESIVWQEVCRTLSHFFLGWIWPWPLKVRQWAFLALEDVCGPKCACPCRTWVGPEICSVV